MKPMNFGKLQKSVLIYLLLDKGEANTNKYGCFSVGPSVAGTCRI